MPGKFVPIGAFVVILTLTLRVVPDVSAQAAELLNDIQNPVVIPNNFPVMVKSLQSSFDQTEADSPCHIEYQVTRRKLGRCVKLGQGMNGCVSGQYMNPFHPDCI